MGKAMILAKETGLPAYVGDGDMVCNKCGELWDVYGIGHGDMTAKERDVFLAGDGCPCCREGG